MLSPNGWREGTSETQQEVQNSERMSISVDRRYLSIIRFALHDVGIYFCYSPGHVDKCIKVKNYGTLHTSSMVTYSNQHFLYDQIFLSPSQ